MAPFQVGRYDRETGLVYVRSEDVEGAAKQEIDLTEVSQSQSAPLTGSVNDPGVCLYGRS